MKRLIALVCLPTIIMGSDSPVNFDKIKKQYEVVQRLQDRLDRFKEEHLNLQRKQQGYDVFIKQVEVMKTVIDQIDPDSELYAIVTTPLEDLIAQHAQDKINCELLAQAIKVTDKELERETWYQTGLEMRDTKEKLAGIADRLKEREQQNLQNTDNQRDGIPAQLVNAKRGGSENELGQAAQPIQDSAHKAIQELFTNLDILEEEVWNFSKTLSQEKDTNEPAPTEAALALLLNLKENITTLKHDLGKMVLAAHPDAQERQTYLASLHAERPSTEQPQAKRSRKTDRISIIIPVVTILR